MRQRQTIDFDYLFTSIVVDTIFFGGGKNPDVVRMEYSDVGSPPLFPSVLFFFALMLRVTATGRPLHLIYGLGIYI
jgi:hypothetical protein